MKSYSAKLLSYLDTSAAPLGVFPRPNSLGAPTGLQYSTGPVTRLGSKQKNPARCAYLYFVVPIVLPPPSYSPVRPREGSVLAVAHGGAIRPFRTSPSRNRKTYTGEFSRAVVRRNCAVVRNGRCGRGNRGESECSVCRGRITSKSNKSCQAQSHFTVSALSSAYRVNRTFVLRFISWCTGGPHGPPSRKSCTHARTCTPRHSVMLDTSTASIRDLPAPKVLWRPQDILLQSYRASALWPRVTFLPHLRLLCSWVVNL